MGRQRPACVDDILSDQFDRARIDQRARGDQHQRDDDHGLVPEALEGVLGRHDAADHGDDQRGEGDQIVANAPPDEEREDDGKQAEKENLFICHLEPPAR